MMSSEGFFFLPWFTLESLRDDPNNGCEGDYHWGGSMKYVCMYVCILLLLLILQFVVFH